MSRVWLLLVFLAACGPKLADVEDGEWLPGGETTNTLLLGSNAFMRPSANLSDEHESEFYSGNSFFNLGWVTAPASTEARDGLGPLYNATSCSGCHFKDGRAAPPDGPDSFPVGSLVRISLAAADGTLGPDPIYGGQIQDIGIQGVPAEATVQITWLEDTDGAYADGTSYTLRRPELVLANPAYGDLPPDLLRSFRVGPATIGLGLLEAISEADLDAVADPGDADGDGISGRLAQVDDLRLGTLAPGRFGWKAEQPTVEQQSAGAFAGDVGITSALFGNDDCTPDEAECNEAISGGDPELDEDTLAAVALYSRTLAPPVREDWESETVLRGKYLFADVGCASCHTATWTTGVAAISELEGQQIWPYTDMLLHDMGDDLSDDRPTGDADGVEWRTPPLWGLGRYPDVSGHQYLLHDGRARGVTEAILWHGGEAEASREAFVALDAEDREALAWFVNAL